MYARQRIVGQQAGIDCDAAMKAVKVPTASGQPDVEPVDTIMKSACRCKTLRDEPAAMYRIRQRLKVAPVPMPFRCKVLSTLMPGCMPSNLASVGVLLALDGSILNASQ